MSPTLSSEELKKLGEQGMIPAPSESEEAFIEQVTLLKEIDKHCKTIFFGKVLEKWTCDFGHKLGADPTWVPLIYSNQGLFFWQGAALWIFETEMHGKIPMIQLKAAFKKGGRFLPPLEEVLLHESVHALRARFHEPRFEEALAYYHASSKWRQFWGPFFRTQTRALFSICLIFFSFSLQLLSLFFFTALFFSYLKFASLLPLIDLLLKGGSLIRDQRVLKQALCKLLQIFPQQKEAFPIAMRLTDAEIEQFAQDSIEKISEYMIREAPKSVRWRQIIAQFS